MARYRVTLYKDLLSSDGHPFHCLQSTTEVEADAPELAIQHVLKGMRGCSAGWDVRVEPIENAGPFHGRTNSPIEA